MTMPTKRADPMAMVMALASALTCALVAGCDAPSPPSASSSASSPTSVSPTSVSPTSALPPSAASAVEAAQNTAPPTDAWLGRWTGPEGSYLLLESGTETGLYKVTIANLDGPRQFEGTAAGDKVQFTRDGKAQLLHATNGVDTGMKWLADKKECLTVNAGEGYCRD
jgi:hypothetical protein